MPAEAAFADTNVLLYAMVPGDPRYAVAERVLYTRPVINVQVLNEFANVTRRKLGWTWRRIEEALDTIQQICGLPRPLTLETHRSGIEIARVHGLAVSDALIVAAALEAGCGTLYSEDMQSGQKMRSLTIRNPFAST